MERRHSGVRGGEKVRDGRRIGLVELSASISRASVLGLMAQHGCS